MSALAGGHLIGAQWTLQHHPAERLDIHQRLDQRIGDEGHGNKGRRTEDERPQTFVVRLPSPAYAAAYSVAVCALRLTASAWVGRGRARMAVAQSAHFWAWLLSLVCTLSCAAR